MSSHHIVKEKQEPALYIHEFASFNNEYLGQLLEWSPTLIVSASEYEKINSLNLKIDIIVGEVPNNLILQENIKVIPTNSNNIFHVFDYLIENDYPAVNVISNIKNFDDFTCFLPKLDIVLFNELSKHYAIKNGFSFWKTKGTKILIDVIAYFEADNLIQLTEDTFEVVEDGLVSFNFSVPYLFLGEYL